jgi:hypothetical protein
MEEPMWETRRSKERIFCGWWMRLVALVLAVPVWLSVGARVEPAQAQSGPATTHIADTVYRADGTPAGGVLLISWGPFTTTSGAAVAAGNLTVTLGAGGALSTDLIPNAAATPASSYYIVVYQLDDYSQRTEFWLVPSTSPANLAAIRATPGSGSAGQMVSRQYVDSALAGKASDSSVVHLSGAETIAGTKQFSLPPSVPAPVGTGDAVNKSYVEIEAITSLFFPGAVELERGAFALLGMAAQAVNDAGSSAEQNGINIALDAQLVADIKSLIAAIEQYAKSAGVQKPAAPAAAK